MPWWPTWSFPFRRCKERLGQQNLAGVGIGVPGFIRMETGVIAGWGNARPSTDIRFATRSSEDWAPRSFSKTTPTLPRWAKSGSDGQGCGRSGAAHPRHRIGGGIIIGGRSCTATGYGRRTRALTISPNGNPCGCGNTGCVEKHASATAIGAIARLINLGPNLSAEDVYKLAVDGNERARTVFRSMGEALGIALANLVNIFNFPLYLLSGGPLPAWEFFAPAMLAEVERRSFTYRAAPTRIEPAKLGNQAGLYGAAYLPFQEQASR